MAFSPEHPQFDLDLDSIRQEFRLIDGELFRKVPVTSRLLPSGSYQWSRAQVRGTVVNHARLIWALANGYWPAFNLRPIHPDRPVTPENITRVRKVRA